MASGFKWYGDKVAKRMQKAARLGINRTMTQAVMIGKHDHRGWKNRTGTAERSIRIIAGAKTAGDGHTFGIWGSMATNYFGFLEERYTTLRSAAKKVYPLLVANIRGAWRSAA